MGHRIAAIPAVAAAGRVVEVGKTGCNSGTEGAYDGQIQRYPSWRWPGAHRQTLPSKEVFPTPSPMTSPFPFREYVGLQLGYGIGCSSLQVWGCNIPEADLQSWRMQTSWDRAERV